MQNQPQKIERIDVLHTISQYKEQINVQKSVGFWNQEQHTKYVIFINFFQKQLNSKGKRRSNRIYKTMSDFILTRDSTQCRSHHIKLIRTFRCIKRIVRNLMKKMGEEEYIRIQKLITSSNDIFDKKIKQIKQVVKHNSGLGLQNDKNIPIKSEFMAVQNFIFPIMNSIEIFEANDNTFQLCAYPTQIAWIYNL